MNNSTTRPEIDFPISSSVAVTRPGPSPREEQARCPATLERSSGGWPAFRGFAALALRGKRRLWQILFAGAVALLLAGAAARLPPRAAILGSWKVVVEGQEPRFITIGMPQDGDPYYRIEPKPRSGQFPGSGWILREDGPGLIGTWGNAYQDADGAWAAGTNRPITVTFSDDQRTATCIFADANGNRTAALSRP